MVIKYTSVFIYLQFNHYATESVLCPVLVIVGLVTELTIHLVLLLMKSHYALVGIEDVRRILRCYSSVVIKWGHHTNCWWWGLPNQQRCSYNCCWGNKSSLQLARLNGSVCNSFWGRIHSLNVQAYGSIYFSRLIRLEPFYMAYPPERGQLQKRQILVWWNFVQVIRIIIAAWGGKKYDYSHACRESAVRTVPQGIKYFFSKQNNL